MTRQRWDKKSIKEELGEVGPALRGLGIFAAIALAVSFIVTTVLPFAIQWADCQRLAPIERWVTRGC